MNQQTHQVGRLKTLRLLTYCHYKTIRIVLHKQTIESSQYMTKSQTFKQTMNSSCIVDTTEWYESKSVSWGLLKIRLEPGIGSNRAFTLLSTHCFIRRAISLFAVSEITEEKLGTMKTQHLQFGSFCIRTEVYIKCREDYRLCATGDRCMGCLDSLAEI